MGNGASIERGVTALGRRRCGITAMSRPSKSNTLLARYAMLGLGSLMLNACSPERTERMEECATLSLGDPHPLCVVYIFTGGEWLISAVFVLGILTAVVEWKGAAREGEDRDTEENEEDNSADDV